MPDVSVDVTNIDINRTVHQTTNGAGLYVVAGLKPGRYRVSVVKEGFRRIDLTDLILNVQDVLSRNFQLQVGSALASITVVADEANVNTESPAVSTVVPRALIDNLPLNGRSFQALINLTPGVVLTPSNFAQPGQFSVNGQRNDANYFTVDGVSANISVSTGVSLTQYGAGVYPGLSASGGTNNLVSMDALQEFRVQTSTFAPEYGRTPGGQISVITRSGANRFHGTAFEYFRNDVLDANDWFANNAGVKRSPLRQNDFGGVFSGPILPNRLFFFLSYEGLRLRLPRTITEEVPSIDFRQNAIPEMQAILNAFPVPNGALEPGGLQNFTGSFTNPSSFDATSLRLDYSGMKRWSFFARYNFSPSASDTRGDPSQTLSPSEVDHFQTTTQTMTVGATTTINSGLANEFRFNFSRLSEQSHSTIDNFGGATPFVSSVIFPQGVDFSNGLLDFNLNALTLPAPLLSVGSNSRNLQRQLNFVDNLTWSRGSHVFKFGADYRRLSPIQRPSSYGQLVAFLDEPSAQQGLAAEAEVFANQRAINFVFTNLSLFAQDTWKVNHRLTLTYGVRWDYNPVPGTGGSTAHPFTLSGLTGGSKIDPTTLTSLAPAGTAFYQNSHHDFAPRIGVAYQFRDRTNWTSIFRGGFGLFNNIANSVIGDASRGFPFSSSNLFFGANYPNPAGFAAPPLGQTQPPYGQIYVTDPNLKSPYSLQWNAAFEQQVGGAQSFSLSYVGSTGHRLIYQDYFFFPNPNFSLISYSTNGATASYNALQVQLRRQVTRGLQALASYNWSHAIDMDSNTEGSVAPVRGNADFDIRHSFTMGASYETPKPGWTGLSSLLLRDWTLDSSIYARTAAPVDLIGGAIQIPAYVVVRPDVVPGQPFFLNDASAPGGKRLNPAAFTPPPNRQGTLGRNLIRGFNAWQFDFAVRRDFRIRESMALQFRTEMFNIFNHPNFGPYDPILFDSTFGRSTQTLAQSLGSGGVNGGFNPLYQIGGPRSIQFAAKLQF